ncbi:MAG TPA: ATP-binding cassette domain-containing protein, partial [Methanoregulaceae archaeon]|nr:ATP-binding cassette domain-containing protein [Methanoregulaceae archaeon]
TTRMLTGVIPPDSGSAMILSYDIQRKPVLAKQEFGVVPETSNAYTDLTAWQNLMLMRELYGISPVRATERSSYLLGTLGLLERKDQKVQTYSKGMKQRLILAMALLHEPRLLFLDEPTSGLDVQSTQMILSLLRDLNRAGTTIFLTTHNMEEANRLCNRVGIIRNGKIVALNAPEKLKAAIDRLHRIEVSFNREIPAEALARLPGVVSADQTGDKWQITTQNHDAVIRLLVQFSREQGAAIVTLNTLAPSLDDAFLRLTQEASP